MINKLQEKSILLKKIGRQIKWGVVGTDLSMTLYVLWLIITNDSTWVIGILFGFTPFGAYELYKASDLFGLCIYHKLMLLHTVLVYGCCVYQAYYGFGEYLYIMRWIMFLFGFLLIIFVAIRSLIKNEQQQNLIEYEHTKKYSC